MDLFTGQKVINQILRSNPGSMAEVSAQGVEGALILLSNFQRHGALCAWLDTEMRFDPMRAAQRDINVSALSIFQSEDKTQLVNVACNLLKEGIHILFLDTISQTVMIKSGAVEINE